MSKGIRILEAYPAIDKNELMYLEQKGYYLLGYEEPYDNNDIEGIVVRSKVIVNAELLDNYPNLKFILRVGVGIDNIDMTLCKEKKIKIYNTPGANADSVADMALCGTLSLLRKVKQVQMDMVDGSIHSRFDYMGEELQSQTVCIVGFGNIGKKVYKRLLGFGVSKFLIYDPFLKKEVVEENRYCEFIEDLDVVLGYIDILYLHLPLNEKTRNFVDNKFFERFRKNIKIINLARGGIINELDLLAFLKKNEMAGAYLDVWEGQPGSTDIVKQLMKLGNCLLTPHLGAMTIQAYKNMHIFEL